MKRDAFTVDAAVVNCRTVVLVEATGPRGGKQSYTVYVNRRTGEVTGAYLDGRGYLTVALLPAPVAHWAERVWRRHYVS